MTAIGIYQSPTVAWNDCSLEQAGDKAKPLVHDVTLLPRHAPSCEGGCTDEPVAEIDQYVVSHLTELVLTQATNTIAASLDEAASWLEKPLRKAATSRDDFDPVRSPAPLQADCRR